MFTDPADAPDVEIIRQKRGTVAKERRCHCGRMIPAGVGYEITVAKVDGKFESCTSCLGWCWQD